MSIFVDLLLLVVICFCLIKHLRLGLVCSILSLLKFVIAFVFALFLGGYVGRLISSFFPSVVGGKLTVILCYVLTFVAAYVLFSIIIKGLSKLDIPVLTKVDKFLGALLGLVFGLLSSSMISVILYMILEVYSAISGDQAAMLIYNDSYIFKFLYDLEIFGIIGNII